MTSYTNNPAEVRKILKRLKEGKGKITPMSKQEVTHATQQYAQEYPRQQYLKKILQEQQSKHKVASYHIKLRARLQNRKILKKDKSILIIKSQPYSVFNERSVFFR